MNNIPKARPCKVCKTRFKPETIFQWWCCEDHKADYGVSPAEIHHLRKGCGVGQRASHKRAIPLCPPHHRTGGYGVAIHAGQKMWEKIYGSEEELLEQILRELGSDLS